MAWNQNKSGKAPQASPGATAVQPQDIPEEFKAKVREKVNFYKDVQMPISTIELLVTKEFSISDETFKILMESEQNNGTSTGQPPVAQAPVSVSAPASAPAPILTPSPVQQAPKPSSQGFLQQSRTVQQSAPAPVPTPVSPRPMPQSSTFSQPATRIGLAEVAKKLTRPESELKDELTKIMAELNVSESGALSVLKGRYDYQLKRKGEPIELVARLITMDGPRDVDRKDGSKIPVANVDFLIEIKDAKTGQTTSAQAQMALWGDGSEKVIEKSGDEYLLWWGDVYKFKCLISGPNPTTRIYTLSPMPETVFEKIPDYKGDLLSILDLVTPSSVKSLSDAVKYADSNAVFSGYVSKQIKNRDGVFFGLAISDDTIETPVTVWTRGRIGELAQNVPPGAQIIVLAYVNIPQDSGDPSLSAKAIYPVPDNWGSKPN